MFDCTGLTESHISGQAIGEPLRRRSGIMPSRNIRTMESSYIATASAGPKGEITTKENKDMTTRSNKKLLSFILCMVLIVAATLFTNGCNGSTGNAVSSGTEAENASVQADSGSSTESDGASDVSVLGEGSTKFAFTVTDQDGNETGFEIHTDKETVGEALLEVGLIEGEESEYGLYVKTVNGITADYDKDGVYWAFYVNGEYAQSGVDSTTITEGETYSFKVGK